MEEKEKFLTNILESYKYCTGENDITFGLIGKELKEKLENISKQTIHDFLIQNKAKLKRTVDKKIERDGFFKSSYVAIRYLSGIIKREIEKGWAANPTIMVEELKKKAGDINVYDIEGNMNPTERKIRPLCELELDLVQKETEDEIND